MGMFDNVKVEYPIEESVQNEIFQTKSFGDSMTGGFMDDYTITKDGKLILHKVSWEIVPEEERPYYGKPEWNKGPIFQIMGCMKSIPLGDEIIEYHGDVIIYTKLNNTWHEYTFRFTNGKVTNVNQIFKEYGK